MPQQNPNSRLVYSTDGGRVPVPKGAKAYDPQGRLAQSKGSASGGAPGPAVPNDGIVRIQRDKRGRGGKTATTISGLPGTEAELDALLKSLKQECGSGGQRVGRVLEIQGDHRERLFARIEALGHKVKLAGG